MSSFSDVLTVTDSEEEDDDDCIEIISESIVTTKPSLVTELTRVEERRLKEQLNLPKNAVVKIRVFGGGIKSDLVGAERVVNCSVTRPDGEVLSKKSLQSKQIFGPLKEPQAADLSELSEILTISDESEPDLDDSEHYLAPLRKLTLRKKQKPTQVTHHLLEQHRQLAGHGQHRGGRHQATGLVQPNKESPLEQNRSLPVCGYTQSGELLSVLDNTKFRVQPTVLGTTPAQHDFDIQETSSAQLDFGTKQSLEAKSRNQETLEETPIFQAQIGSQEQEPAQESSQSEYYVLEPDLFQSDDQETESLESDDQHPNISNEQAVVSDRSECQAANKDSISDQGVFPGQHDDHVSSSDQIDDETVTEAYVSQDPISTHGVNQAHLTDGSYFQAAVAVLDDEQTVTTVPSDEQVAVLNEKANITDHSDAQAEICCKVTNIPPSQVHQTSAPSSKSIASQTNVTKFSPPCHDIYKEAVAAEGPPCTDNASFDNHNKSVRDDSSTERGHFTSLLPSISSLDITAVKAGSGQLFLPTSQLSQLLPPDTSCVDVVSICPNLKEDTIWSGWEVSHISLTAAIRVLDRYEDVYSLREDLAAKQQLEVDKETFMGMMGLCRVEYVETMESDMKIRREIARRSRTTRSGTRRKQLPAEFLRGGKRSRGSSVPRTSSEKGEKKGKRRN